MKKKRENYQRDEEKIYNSLDKAGLYNKINELPSGINSILTKEFDQNGVVLSGGESQKLTIARMITKNPEIIILDEPSSALDPLAEETMYKNIFDIFKDKTIIFITHRLSSTTMADKIYLLGGGEVLECGTHKELLENNGLYAEMWHKQAEKYIERKYTNI